MTAISMIDTVGKFAAALDDLRRKQLGAFEVWLDGALGKNPDTVEKEIAERIAGARKQLADDFINIRAPALIAELKPEAKVDIIQQLRSFAAQADLVRHFDPMSHEDDRWQPGVLRPMLGAALGAVTGLLLFLMQAGTPIPTSAPDKSAPAAQAQPAPMPQPVPPPADRPATDQATPAGPQSESPTVTPSSRPAPTPRAATPAAPRPSFEQSAFLVISGALGAAFGAFVVVCPPLRRPTLVGSGAGPLALARRAGWALLLLRGGALAAAASAAVTAAIGFLGLLFTGPKPLWTVLLGLAAAFLIVLFRWAFPQQEKRDRRQSARTAAASALDRELKVDAQLWAVLAAGLATRPAAGPSTDPKLDLVRSIILARRDRAEPDEAILTIVEQELDLPTGPRAAAVVKIPTEFTWEPRHADLYEPFGLIKPGDKVEVKVPPQMTTNAQGIETVFQKGTVVRKR